MLFLALMTTMSLGLYACRDNTPMKFTPAPTLTLMANDLPSEVVAQDNWDNDGTNYEDQEPAIFIIRHEDELTLISEWVQSDFIMQLQNIDYEVKFVVLIFQGYKPTSGYSVQLKRVIAHNNVIDVYVHFDEPELGDDVEQVETSPYLILAVSRSENWSQISTFNLVADEVVKATYSLGMNTP